MTVLKNGELAQRIQQALLAARETARERGIGVFDAVCDVVAVAPETLAECSQELLAVRFVGQAELSTVVPEFGILSFSDSVERKTIAARLDGTLCLITDDPWDSAAISRISARASEWPDVLWARASDIIWAANRATERVGAIEQLSPSLAPASEDASPGFEISLDSIERTQNQVVKFVDSIIFDGWRNAASDIHVETGRTGITVKFRLDGVLVESARFDDMVRVEEVINRIKVLAQLDISERRVPQDGRFRVRLSARNVDFRVSVMPSIFGEDAVIRILDKSQLHQDSVSITLNSLGFETSVKSSIRLLAEAPHGMLLVTGPTGSGKTTTLYAVISEIKTGLEKFVTIEDPVEYELPGVLQIPVNEKKGLTFSKGLRSILRHDPDKILVGEIRDAETAEIAVQAALTGHGVFTTMHANNPFDVVGRFIHMGIDLFSFASALNGIVSQRLVRRVCTACAEPALATERFLSQIAEFAVGESLADLRKGRGCEACRFTGYKGRFALAEVVMMDDVLRQMLIDRAGFSAIKAETARRGWMSLRQAGVAAVIAGQTTEEEYRRVVAAS